MEQHERRARAGGRGSQRQRSGRLAQGTGSAAGEASRGDSEKWLRSLGWRYKRAGLAGRGAKRAGHSGRKAELWVKRQVELPGVLLAAWERQAKWRGRRVAVWLSERRGHALPGQGGDAWLWKVGCSPPVGRQQPVQAPEEASRAIKKRSGWP